MLINTFYKFDFHLKFVDEIQPIVSLRHLDQHNIFLKMAPPILVNNRLQLRTY